MKHIKIITSPDQLDTINSRTPFIFICKICKIKQYISGWKDSIRKEKYKRFICSSCSFSLNYPVDRANEKRTRTFNKLYNTDSVGAVKEFQFKIKHSKKIRYGDPNYNNHDKASKTYFDKTGYKTPLNNRTLVEHGMIEKYNVKHPAQNKDILKKMQNTYFERTSYNNPMKNPKVMKQFKNNTMKKYGVKYYFLSDDYKQKMINLYGTPYVPYPKIWRYEYAGSKFDSAWELALWIYAIDHNEEIIREPISFKYIYDGIEHVYIPDFKYKGNYIEIKGSQFFDENGKMICPYSRLHSDGPFFTKSEKKYMDDLYEAKHQCGINNNVLFWGKEEIKPYMDYVENKYGIDYLCKFKIKKK